MSRKQQRSSNSPAEVEPRPAFRNCYVNDLADVLIIAELIQKKIVEVVSLDSFANSHKIVTLNEVCAGTVWVVEIPWVKIQWTDTKVWARFTQEGCFQTCSEINPNEHRARRPVPVTNTTLHKKTVTIETKDNRRLLIMSYYTPEVLEKGGLLEMKYQSDVMSTIAMNPSAFTSRTMKVVNAAEFEVEKALNMVQTLLSDARRRNSSVTGCRPPLIIPSTSIPGRATYPQVIPHYPYSMGSSNSSDEPNEDSDTSRQLNSSDTSFQTDIHHSTHNSTYSREKMMNRQDLSHPYRSSKQSIDRPRKYHDPMSLEFLLNKTNGRRTAK